MCPWKHTNCTRSSSCLPLTHTGAHKGRNQTAKRWQGCARNCRLTSVLVPKVCPKLLQQLPAGPNALLHTQPGASGEPSVRPLTALPENQPWLPRAVMLMSQALCCLARALCQRSPAGSPRTSQGCSPLRAFCLATSSAQVIPPATVQITRTRILVPGCSVHSDPPLLLPGVLSHTQKAPAHPSTASASVMPCLLCTRRRHPAFPWLATDPASHLPYWNQHMLLTPV